MTNLYEMTIRVSIKVEANDKAEAEREAKAIAYQIQRELPTGASVEAINGDSLQQI